MPTYCNTENNPIDSFRGEHAFLSNFYPSPIVYEGRHYPTVEHAYQAAKTVIAEEKEIIQQIPRPGPAKRAGRRVTLRKDWESIKIRVMDQLIKEKFKPGSQFTRRLLDTGDLPLQEGNTWGDTYWGICNEKGHNHLGKILMKRRHELRHAH